MDTALHLNAHAHLDPHRISSELAEMEAALSVVFSLASDLRE